MDDFSHLSDDELKRLYHSHNEKEQHSEEDLSHLSNEELQKRYASSVGETPQPKTDSGWRGDIAAGLRGVRAGIPFARDVATGVESLRKGVPFWEESKHQQERDLALQKEHPKSYFGGEVAGTFMPLGAPGYLVSGGRLAAGPSIAKLATGVEEGLAKKLTPYVGKGLGSVGAAGTVGAGIGAAQGIGEGEDAESRLKNAGMGTVFGGALGAASPVVTKALGITSLTPAEEAAESFRKKIRSTGDVDYSLSVPTSVASENLITRAVTPLLSAFPFSKPFIDEGVRKGITQLEEGTRKIPGILSPGLTSQQAGESASEALKNWVNVESKKPINELYEKVKYYVDPLALNPIKNTRSAIGEIGQRRVAAYLEKSPLNDSLAQALEKALKAPNGLTYDGLQRLKQEVGAKLKGNITQSDLNQTELENLYSALRKDVENAARNAGGEEGHAAFLKANEEGRKTIENRERLGKIIGIKGDVNDEQVFKNLTNYAKEGGNEKLLKLARDSMQPESWNNVTSGIIEHLGRNRDRTFSPETLVKNFGEMSENNKTTVFGEVGTEIRDALEELNTISKRYAETGRSRNFSNTALALSGLLGVFGVGSILQNPTEGLSKDLAIGASSVPIALVLSKPRLAAMVTRYFRAATNPEREGIVKDLETEVKRYFPNAKEFRSGVGSQVRRALTPKGAVSYAPITADDREERASGGRLGKGDYPAKRLSRMEKAVIRAQKAIAMETKPIMDQPDHVVARALEIAMNK